MLPPYEPSDPMPLSRSRGAWTAVAISLALGGAVPADAQDRRTVSGTVSDSGGRPIPYVNIDGLT